VSEDKKGKPTKLEIVFVLVIFVVVFCLCRYWVKEIYHPVQAQTPVASTAIEVAKEKVVYDIPVGDTNTVVPRVSGFEVETKIGEIRFK
jgi:hypothetical protein